MKIMYYIAKKLKRAEDLIETDAQQARTLLYRISIHRCTPDQLEQRRVLLARCAYKLQRPHKTELYRMLVRECKQIIILYGNHKAKEILRQLEGDY